MQSICKGSFIIIHATYHSRWCDIYIQICNDIRAWTGGTFTYTHYYSWLSTIAAARAEWSLFDHRTGLTKIRSPYCSYQPEYTTNIIVNKNMSSIFTINWSWMLERWRECVGFCCISWNHSSHSSEWRRKSLNIMFLNKINDGLLDGTESTTASHPCIWFDLSRRPKRKILWWTAISTCETLSPHIYHRWLHHR